MPAFPLQDSIQRGARTHRRRHRAQRARMSFFFDRASSQKILHIVFSGERPLRLIVKFRFLLFFRRFHAANGNLWSGDFVPPAI